MDPKLVKLSWPNDFNEKITLNYSNCERLDVLVQKEPPARRHNSKIRVDQLKYDVRHLQSSFQNMQAKQYERERFEREREELMHTKFTTNANANNGSASDTSILIDRALEHNSALQVLHLYV